MHARRPFLTAALSVLGAMALPAAGETAAPMISTPIDPAPANWQALKPDQRLADLRHRRLDGLKSDLRAADFHLGNPAFIRVFKESSELELWLQKSGATTFEKWKTYPVARWSGDLGPKEKEGDGQAPEGIYNVVRQRLNPASTYHLSFNIGYPNAYDKAHDRTGGLIMVHGKDVSIGCYAMTDPGIEEIYLLIEAALNGEKEVPVHCFPFRMTEERLAQARTENGPWVEFWNELLPVWQAFETTHVPPVVRLGSKYALEK